MGILSQVSWLAITAPLGDAFVHLHRRHVVAPSMLEAKKAGKAKKKSAVAGGSGFGAKAPSSKPKGDFSAFPKLEPQVQATLDPSPEDWATEADQLPREIYDRLHQIYGFEHFNSDNVDSDAPVSFSELLMSPSEEQTSKPNAELDFSDLLSPSASSPQMADTSATSEAQEDLSIANLSPFTQFRVLHVDPLVLAVDDFFSDEECNRYVHMAKNNNVMRSKSPTVGKDANAKAQRTSTTYYHHFENVPELVAKASRLLGLDAINRWEEPQTVRYRSTEKFTWHLDALGPIESKPELGGQRLATLLVYLTDLEPSEGGATMFRDLGKDGKPLEVRPKKGSAMLFFPAAGGVPNAPFDVRTLHCGQAVSEDAKNEKWIAQMWLRQNSYSPTAPPGNSHAGASEAIVNYCTS